MSDTLPPPGSIWIYRPLHRQQRVVISNEAEILTHDAELSDRYPSTIPISSWRGTPAEFAQKFEPGNTDNYPKTAA